ncbi:MAG: SGNH/GDSL hydrolase family protein [Myxococcota bacterium]
MRGASLALLTLLCGCAEDLCGAFPPGPARVLILGDSVLAWNSSICQSVAHHAAWTLGKAADIRAVISTQLMEGDALLPAITDQYSDGDWEWVVLDGGGNDLNKKCACGECGDLLDRLVDVGGRKGAMPELVDRARARGAKVILLGYYDVGPDAAYGFAECRDEIHELNRRYRHVAAQRRNVFFVSGGDVLNPDRTPDLYDVDRVHPAPNGAEKLGQLIGRTMREN